MSVATSTPQASSGQSTSTTHSATSLPPTSTSTPSSASASGSGSSSTSTSKSSHKPKPTNVFSDDGSFLERFQRVKREDEDKKKRDQELESKRMFESRFRNRGKRRAPSAEPTLVDSSDSASASTSASSKKAKLETEKPLTAYEKEVKSYSDSLKDNGMGIRPLVK
ncbi:hypothetical protein M0805_000846 [Coniferiporia weirii]|nr:hypothetical protein M0805_000846 [Coniferiporia weirii]